MAISKLLYGSEIKFGNKRYTIVKANNKNEICVSFYNKNNNKFIRHADSKILETDSSYNEYFFIDDSSFIPEEKGEFFVFRCSNKGMLSHYICKIDSDTYIVNTDLKEYLFNVSKNKNNLYKEKYEYIGSLINIHDNDFIIVGGNDLSEDTISLININTGNYIRHKDGILVEEKRTDDTLFVVDSSFVLEDIIDGFNLHCSNEGMNKMYICKIDSNFQIGNIEHAYKFPFNKNIDYLSFIKKFFENKY